VGRGELDEVCGTDVFLLGNAREVAADLFEAAVLAVGALVGEDEGAVAGTVEAIVERTPDRSPCRVGTLAVGEELCGKGGGDFVPDGRAGRWCVSGNHGLGPVEEILDGASWFWAGIGGSLCGCACCQ